MRDKLLQVLFCFLATGGLVTGIIVGPVRLASMELYIDYQHGASESKSLIECPIKLEDGEELKEVSWILYEDDKIVGRYFWNPDSGGKAENLLTDVVRLDRDDWGLELIELRYDLSGFYSCSATTTDDTTDEAAKWEVLIIDVINPQPKESLLSSGHCKFASSFNMTAIYPQPTIHSGLYSESLGGYFEEVRAVDWHKQAFTNKSYGYSHEDVIFEITNKAPHDIYFMNSVGMLKKDGTYISLFSIKTVLHDFEERGCPPVKIGAYQRVKYSNGGTQTCRGEILPPGAGQLRATVVCIDGYKADDPKGYQEMELGCSQKSWKWGIPNDYPSLALIKCVVDDSAFTASGSTLLVMACLLALHLLQQ